MADRLVDVEEIEVRLGRAFTDVEAARAEALIDDVSGEIYALVGDDAFHDDNNQVAVPTGVVGIICRAVIRQFENPRGLTGEGIGDYNWQANNGRAETSVFFTAAERKQIRRAAGLSALSSIQMEGDLALTGFYDITTLTWQE